jgi:TetR/AcrR family transcriptional regulator, repressor for uid operon
VSPRKPGPRGRPVNLEAREERRRQILDGARRCFQEKGFHAASTADISEAAGVSVANLYQYFPSKHELVLAIAEEDFQGDLALGEVLRGPGPLLDRLEAILEGLADQAEQGGVFALRMEIVAEAQRNPEMRALLRKADAALVRGLARFVERAQAAGEIAKDLDPLAVSSALHRLFDGFFVGVGGGLAGRRALIAELARMLRRGLAPPRRR